MVTITAETSALGMTLEELVNAAEQLPGVLKCVVLAG